MNIDLYYREKGKGEVLVLLHGNSDSSKYFVNQIEFFKDNYRVIALDTRGHGNSPRGDMPLTISQFADDLNNFLNKLNIEKINLLGFSDGANIAMKFALKYPEKLNALILDGGNLNKDGVSKLVGNSVELFYKLMKLMSKKSESAKKYMELLNLLVNEPNIKPEELNKINIPTLVMAGTKDLIKSEHTKLIHENINGSELIFIDGGHLIAKQNHEEFNKEVLKFLIKKKN